MKNIITLSAIAIPGFSSCSKDDDITLDL